MNILNHLFSLIVSFYSLSITDVDNNTISLNSYQGKKILLVNIATGSSRVGQLGTLQQLQQTFGDSLVVIAFPSNSFGHESRSDSAIKQFCISNYGTTYKIIKTDAVAGTIVQPVYYWLKQIEQNGAMYGAVGGDFQKFLINESGQLIGTFAPAIDPMDPIIRNAITTHN